MNDPRERQESQTSFAWPDLLERLACVDSAMDDAMMLCFFGFSIFDPQTPSCLNSSGLTPLSSSNINCLTESSDQGLAQRAYFGLALGAMRSLCQITETYRAPRIRHRCILGGRTEIKWLTSFYTLALVSCIYSPAGSIKFPYRVPLFLIQSAAMFIRWLAAKESVESIAAQPARRMLVKVWPALIILAPFLVAFILHPFWSVFATLASSIVAQLIFSACKDRLPSTLMRNVILSMALYTAVLSQLPATSNLGEKEWEALPVVERFIALVPDMLGWLFLISMAQWFARNMATIIKLCTLLFLGLLITAENPKNSPSPYMNNADAALMNVLLLVLLFITFSKGLNKVIIEQMNAPLLLKEPRPTRARFLLILRLLIDFRPYRATVHLLLNLLQEDARSCFPYHLNMLSYRALGLILAGGDYVDDMLTSNVIPSCLRALQGKQNKTTGTRHLVAIALFRSVWEPVSRMGGIVAADVSAMGELLKKEHDIVVKDCLVITIGGMLRVNKVQDLSFQLIIRLNCIRALVEIINKANKIYTTSRASLVLLFAVRLDRDAVRTVIKQGDLLQSLLDLFNHDLAESVAYHILHVLMSISYQDPAPANDKIAPFIICDVFFERLIHFMGAGSQRVKVVTAGLLVNLAIESGDEQLAAMSSTVRPLVGQLEAAGDGDTQEHSAMALACFLSHTGLQDSIPSDRVLPIVFNILNSDDVKKEEAAYILLRIFACSRSLLNSFPVERIEAVFSHAGENSYFFRAAVDNGSARFLSHMTLAASSSTASGASAALGLHSEIGGALPANQ